MSVSDPFPSSGKVTTVAGSHEASNSQDETPSGISTVAGMIYFTRPFTALVTVAC